ncbi:protein transport protein Sec16A isoform X6 [Aricia agestis]|uniref:protein transport protein Sec16A isoform X6 n=1 Tax=Aricia agestis TaxID=91739 RepID=UPI001C208A9E|nr:protein transport protein Sec16A isoform X6 [Aricia agestis]
MSWMKRPPGGAAPPAPDQQFAAPQAYGNQPNMYPNYHGAPGVQQQQMWPMPQQQQQPQYGQQQYGQTYQQQNYNNGTNQFYQGAAPVNQNYTNQNYENTQQGYQQNYYHNQPQMQQNIGQSEGGTEGWEDNWGWGWEESSKQNLKLNQVPSQPQPVDNANIIEESFAPSNNWNWSMEEKTESRELASDRGNHNRAIPPVDIPDKQTVQNTKLANNSTTSNTENLDVRNLSDRDAVKELPNLAAGKRFHLENLTPQWSIESQMSQDSSDGPTQSDGKYRSENPSRNSSKDSPGPTTDSSNFQYSQASYNEVELSNNEWSNNSNEEVSGANKTSNRRKESHDELLNSMQEMNLGNHELPPKNSQVPSGSYSSMSSLSTNSLVTEQSQSHSDNVVASSAAAVLPPPPPASSVSQPVQPPTSNLPPSASPAPPPVAQQPVSSAPLPPPVGFPPSGSQNPFKHAGAFSHKTAAKAPLSSSTGLPFPIQGVPLSSPSVVNQFVQQDNHPGGFGANLETTPDNSERPDQPPIPGYRSVGGAPQLPDNMEIAPQNDRNEYLQTAHLSGGDYGENTDFSRAMPPPAGIRRMGVGQQDVEYPQSLNVSGDEPPPGLARMVPGQQTEVDDPYRPADFMDRQIDGRPTDAAGRPDRRADGQQTQDDYNLAATRGADRRPIGLDRMVPGEPSNDEYNQYQSASYGASEQRVVPGVDCDFPGGVDAPPNIREQNLDGSDYSEQAGRGAGRSAIGAREAAGDAPVPDFTPALEDQQREVTVEGENLQDLNVAPGGESVTAVAADSHKDSDRAESIEFPRSDSRKHSLNRVTSGEDSERDRTYKSSPRKDRDKHKARDHDRDKEGRYSRGDRKERDGERRSGRDDRRPDKERRDRDRRDDSPDGRRHKRSSRSHRYETEDTDYYSDRERERRRYREGSYTSSKPPRPDDKERRYDDRGRRYNTIERDRRYDDERDRRRGERRDRFERRYRDIDPRKYNVRREDDDRKKVGYGVHGDEYATRRQYEYYERLRLADPAAYMRLYKQLTDPAYAKYYADAGYAAGGRYDVRADDRGSVHSGRSSANGLKHTDTYGGWRAELSELRGAPSLRTDISDRELTTDMSLNLQLEESTVRSERMTPFKFVTSHVKGCVGARSLVVCRGGGVAVLSLSAALRHDPAAMELAAFPGPLVKGVSHKSRVVQYCESRAGEAGSAGGVWGGGDAAGRALVWRLLALLLRQNGVVVGGDIAELLMKHTHDFPYKPPAHAHETRRESSASRASRDDAASPPLADDGVERETQRGVDERAAIDRLRELLLYGNRQEAIEWAMSCGLWGHALQLAADRRARAAVAARFVAALPPADPLHTLYHTLAARAPPAATAVLDEAWGDWRPHAAVILANASARPDHDRRALLQLGDSLGARGLPYSAQFCYLAAGEQPARHPLAPLVAAEPAAPRPRLSLLLADPRAPTLARHATADALHATEVYEYALSLSRDFVLQELVPYKLLQAVRLVDAGLSERALGYCERAARALAAAPHAHSAALAGAVAALADRLQHLDPALADDDADPDDDGADSSPRRERRWLRDVHDLAAALRADSQAGTPQHAPAPQPHDASQWADQTLQQTPPAAFPDPVEEAPDYAAQYHMQQMQQQHEQHQQHHQQLEEQQQQHQPQQHESQYADDWQRPDDSAQAYADPYWAPDSTYQYSEPSAWAGDAAPPTITMPGASSARPARPALYDDYDDTPNGEQAAERDTDSPKPAAKESKGDDKGKGGEGKGGGWLGGFLNKLSLRAPNQMILPDDKNPTIVWDETNKCWRDTAAPADAPPAAPPAPPPSQPRGTSTPLQSPGAPPPAGNLFQLQKKNIKKAYVNVLGGSGATRPAPAGPAPAPLAAPPQFFVPPPVPMQPEMYDPTQMGDGDYRGGM